MDAIEAQGFALVARPGATPVADLGERHVELAGLDLDRLVAIVRLVRDHLRGNALRYTFAREEFRVLLGSGVVGGRIDAAALDPELLGDVLE